MKKLLDLYLDKTDKITIYTTTEGLEKTGELSDIKVFYKKTTSISLQLLWDCFQDIDCLTEKLQLCIDNKLQLHESINITKSLGWYWNRYTKNDQRKDLVYKVSDSGSSYWVGGKYRVYSPSLIEDPNTWLYNDKQGNIWMELSPQYPWFYQDPDPQEGEVFITYRDWMKTYQPYVIRTIPKESAKEWIKQIDDLTKIVLKVSQTLPCAGLLNCICCIKEEKSNA